MKNIITLTLILLLTTTTWSQDTWTRTFGGTDEELGRSITTTSDGGVAITGYTKSNDLDFQGMNKGGEDIFVIKLDKGGNVLWKKLIGGKDNNGGEGPERGQSITNTSDGGVVITGVTNSRNGDFYEMNPVWGDVFVIKLDKDGNVLWRRTFGGTGSEEGHFISTTPDGGILITGETYSNDGSFWNEESYLKDKDIFVIKLDKDGKSEWNKIFGGTSEDIGESLTTTSDGGILITGMTYSNDGDFKWMNKGKMDRMNTDIFVIRLDKNGNVLWKKTFGGSERESGQSITTTSDGRILITGWTDSYDGDFEGKKKYSRDIFVINLDKSGSILWKNVGLGCHDSRSITTTSNGSVLITGGESDSGSDIFVIKLDKDGKVLWKKVFGGKGKDGGYSITTSLDGSILITGETYSNDGDFKGMNKGGGFDYVRKEVSTDIFVIKLDPNGNLKSTDVKSKKK